MPHTGIRPRARRLREDCSASSTVNDPTLWPGAKVCWLVAYWIVIARHMGGTSGGGGGVGGY
jgi:hypothetical protein